MNLHEAASRCDKVRWQGKDSFLACCPVHDDRTPSLSVSERDGKLLWHCHAGCPQEAVYEALGGSTPRPYIPPPKAPRRRDTATYARELWLQSDWGDTWVASHPYAVKKRVTHAFGVKRGTASGKLIGRNADCLIVPMRDFDNRLTGVECINRHGVKQTFGSKGKLILGHPEGAEVIHVCEGWATAWALSQMFPDPFGCVVAFGANRMDRVGYECWERYRVPAVIHGEGAENRDAWDRWDGGEGPRYVERIRGMLGNG